MKRFLSVYASPGGLSIEKFYCYHRLGNRGADNNNEWQVLLSLSSIR
jgi:hypothetical protein